jgi:ribosomal protein S18 acetylase RimI-like enzyme
MRSCETIVSRSPERLGFEPESFRHVQRSKGNEEGEILRFIPVRDYKDRAILRGLQLYARSENPGFVWFDEEKDRAKLAWIRRGRFGEVAGYCISKEGRYEYSDYARRDVYVPRYISQIFVTRDQRRRSVASMMVSDFASEGEAGILWVESPKRETIAMLQKLGFRESRERYQLWEMMFGLTCWTCNGKTENTTILPDDQSLTSANCHEPWLWSGGNAVEMAALR